MEMEAAAVYFSNASPPRLLAWGGNCVGFESGHI
jgi:hypothetical protein